MFYCSLFVRHGTQKCWICNWIVPYVTMKKYFSHKNISCVFLWKPCFLFPLTITSFFPSIHQIVCFLFLLQARAVSCSLLCLCLHPRLCRLAQRLGSPSLFASLWHPACWCPTPTLSCPTFFPLRLSRRAALRGCFRYVMHKTRASVAPAEAEWNW